MSTMLSYICIAILAFVQIVATQESYATVLAEQLNQYCALRDGNTGGASLGTPRVGKAGPRGHPGAIGPRGPLGPTGSAGPIGNPGPVGKTGALGPRGLPGPTGSVGPIGNSGPVGERGAGGPRGPTGPAGPIGNPGPVGETGSPGMVNYAKIEQMIIKNVKGMMTPAKQCTDVYLGLPKSQSASGGVFDIYPPSYPEGTEVFCDTTTDGGGWTLFQRRMDGSVDFDRNWNDYVNGFGSPDGEYWMGLEKLHRLTSDGNYELRVDLGDWEQNKVYAKYSTFSVGDASDKYRLRISGYSGTARGFSGHHDNTRFSTPDQDNDGSESNHCAQGYEGGWWFNNCFTVHLNGVYSQQSAISSAKGILWSGWKGAEYSLKFTEMKFRRMIS